MDLTFNFNDEGLYNLYNTINPVNENGERALTSVVTDYTFTDDTKTAITYDFSNNTLAPYTYTDAWAMQNREGVALISNEKLEEYTKGMEKLGDATAQLNALNELFTKVGISAEELESKISEFTQKIVELEEQNSTLSTERENSVAAFEKAQEQIETLSQENSSLKEFKLGVEKAQKESVINQYAGKLSQETLDKFTAKIDTYSDLTQLDMELTYAQKQESPSSFSVNEESNVVIPKPVKESGIEAVLRRYENK